MEPLHFWNNSEPFVFIFYLVQINRQLGQCLNIKHTQQGSNLWLPVQMWNQEKSFISYYKSFNNLFTLTALLELAKPFCYDNKVSTWSKERLLEEIYMWKYFMCTVDKEQLWDLH